jgi:hypothetical protein
MPSEVRGIRAMWQAISEVQAVIQGNRFLTMMAERGSKEKRTSCTNGAT